MYCVCCNMYCVVCNIKSTCNILGESTVGLEVFADMNFSLFLRFTPDCENIIHGNYDYFSTVMNSVLHCACMHCLHGNVIHR